MNWYKQAQGDSVSWEEFLKMIDSVCIRKTGMDRDFYPTNESLKREELEFIFAGIEEVGQKLNKIITELEFSEVCNESIKCVLIRQGIML